MPKRITTLTPEQRAAMAGWAQQWIEHGHRTGALTEDEWARVEAGIIGCYRYAGLEPPKRIIRVGSPLVVAMAGPIAAKLIKDGANVRSESVRKNPRPGSAVDSAVGSAVGSAVYSAVYSAVGSAVYSAVLRRAMRNGWHRIYRGTHSAYWHAFTSYFRDVVKLELAGDTWDRDRAYADADSAGWWYPHTDFVIICDRPTVLHLEKTGQVGWGSHRLHCETGPAVAWPDGYALHYWHGTRVPAELIEGPGWTTDQILREDNAEVRRCAIERMGWPRFISDAHLRQVGQCVDDPGNPGQQLTLYDAPASLFAEPVRVLVCTNGTPEADGSRHQFGLTVPASITDPVAAAAWTFGCTARDYALLQRAT